MPRRRFFRELSALLRFSAFSLEEASMVQTCPMPRTDYPIRTLPCPPPGHGIASESSSASVMHMHCHPASLIDVLATVIGFAHTAAILPSLPIARPRPGARLATNTCRGRRRISRAFARPCFRRLGARHPPEARSTIPGLIALQTQNTDGAKCWKCGSASSAWARTPGDDSGELCGALVKLLLGSRQRDGFMAGRG
ncbi:hypothetical protein GY45DRAFT_65005 [Cubamyces sp. BRFM 1775]|nr:hypothetical protein GY45DRAFT_65005 [Cubamyces sp. BRFM 1775]